MMRPQEEIKVRNFTQDRHQSFIKRISNQVYFKQNLLDGQPVQIRANEYMKTYEKDVLIKKFIQRFKIKRPHNSTASNPNLRSYSLWYALSFVACIAEN